jgi:hypothetical protein
MLSRYRVYPSRILIYWPVASELSFRRALRKNCLAAAASRRSVNRKSMVCPVESTARYRKRSVL